MRRQGRSLLLATLLCILSLPLHATVARTLLPETLVQVLGLLLSIFLGFRYSQAYNRWWEARVLWGALVNESRNWRDLLTRVLPSQLPLSLRRRLLQQVVLMRLGWFFTLAALEPSPEIRLPILWLPCPLL